MRTLTDLQCPAPDSGRATTLSLDVQATRTFDTPAFRGITFHEVLARSALNRVKGMPFEWSINPYRGCSHACTYCLGGDTPVLMADGRSTPIKDVRAGDRVYGTVRVGQQRRLIGTAVHDQWETVRRAWRVTLEDGTRLVASRDHRFLTDRGWKHVTWTEHGCSHRPHLTTGVSLRGFGSLGAAPPHCPDFRRGYLCGMIRGRGLPAGNGETRAGRSRGPVRRLRAGLAEGEALDRTQRFLESFGVSTQCRPVAAAAPGRRAVTALHADGAAGVAAIRRLTELPAVRSDAWSRGIVSGLLDAQGSGGGGVLSIPNRDPELLEALCGSLTHLGARHVVEPAGVDGARAVRLIGGVVAQLRLLQAVDPIITSRRDIDGLALTTSGRRLGVVDVEDLGLDMPMYDISTGTGDFFADGVVSHNCFARPTHRYLNLSPGQDFEQEIVVKTNVVEVLRHELRRPSWTREHVAMGTNTDPYQRAEGRYRLMPGIIDALADASTPFSILTKGTLITRDIPRLVAASQRTSASAALTIGMLDRDLWRLSEPGTPSPAARLAAVRRLNDAGIATGVMLAPIMPGLNDDPEALTALVDAAAEARAVHISPIVLHTRGEVRGLVREWLARVRPDVLQLHERLYARSGTVDRGYADEVTAHVARARTAAWRRLGRPSPPPGWRGDGDDRRPPVAAEPGAARPVGPSSQVEQLSLL